MNNFFKATFEGWMEVMQDSVDSTEVNINTPLVRILAVYFQLSGAAHSLQ